RRDVDDHRSARSQVKQEGLQELRLMRNVLKHIKQEDRIESIVQRRVALKNVIAAYSAAAADVLLQRTLIQIEASDFPPVGILNLPLQQPVTAPDFRQFART